MKRKTKRREHAAALSLAGLLVLTGYLLGRCSAPQMSEPATIEYETVRVESGDTLWSICSEYCPDGMDIREYIYKVEKHGKISAVIYPGQLIEVPVYD